MTQSEFQRDVLARVTKEMLPDWERTIKRVGNDMMLLQTHVYFEMKTRELTKRIVTMGAITILTNCIGIGYLIYTFTHP